MADQNPLLTGSSSFPMGGPVLDWIREAVLEGEGLMRNDPLYDMMDRNMDYVIGKQAILNQSPDNPPYLSKIVVNETHRAIRRHVSGLTDIKPVYGFRTSNPNFQQHGLLLNQLVSVHWINTFADLALADATKYAATAGAGDIILEWDPFYGPLGDMRMLARDPRDTIPIRPSRDGSIQNWFGCILREAHSPNVLQAMYPQYKQLLLPDVPWGSGVFTKFKATFNRIMGSGERSTLAGLNRVQTGRLVGDEIILYRCYFNDSSINTTAKPILMGQVGTSWSYLVPPGERLYPRKRLVVSSDKVILYDGPNTYWHGMFPVTRLMLDRWPWSFFGLPLVHMMQPLQDGINSLLSAMVQKVKVNNAPPIAGNARVPRTMLQGFDMRRPNSKIHTNEQIGTGLTPLTLPDLPAYTMELFQTMRTMFHELAGDATLDQLQQAAMRQIPDQEQIEAFMSALSPEMKLEGRQIEVCIRELADMQKANFFQHYNSQRRMMVLGDAGLTLQDFDYDPGNLIPAMRPQDAGYTPELDQTLDQQTRAQYFLKLFTFYVTPNSLLSLNAKSEQMMYLQLARAGWCDFWTLMEKLQIANVGSPPLMMLPMAQQPGPEQIQAIQAGMVPGAAVDPQTGQVLSLRQPTTITERLQAQAMTGLGMQVNPAGRKASGQAGPAVEQKPTPGGGTRTTVTESRR